MDRYEAMRLRRGDRVTFSEGGTPGHLSHKLNKGTVVEVSRPDAGRGRKGGGILVEVDTRLKEWIPYFRVVKRYDPCRPLVRQLIAEGFIEPDDIVEIYRGDVLCFAPCRAIHWAAWDTVDDPRDGLVRRPAYIGPHVPDLKSGRGLLAPQRAPLQHERLAV